MKLTEFLLAELDREMERSRRALEQVPEGKYDWKPHDKSMIFGYLANMIATITGGLHQLGNLCLGEVLTLPVSSILGPTTANCRLFRLRGP